VKRIPVLALLSLVAIIASSCASRDPKAPTAENFTAAINASLRNVEQTPPFGIAPCISVDVVYNDRTSPQIAQVLVAHNLIRVLGVDSALGFGIGVDKYLKYSFTRGAQPFRAPEKNEPPMNQLCYGRVVVNRIVSFTEPSNILSMTVTRATYTYDVVDVADWAKAPDVQRAFSEIKTELEGAKRIPQTANLVLTNVGWQVQ
jgi:hypothetical protein